jgi:hypothetical protein
MRKNVFLNADIKELYTRLWNYLKKYIIIPDRFNEYNCPMCTGLKASGT